MIKLNNNGGIGIILAIVITSLVAVGAIVFGIETYQSEQKYKNDDNQLIAAAVQSEQKIVIAKEQQKFNVEQQNPFKTYSGPAEYGSVRINYPKDWSAYVDLTNSSNDPINAYFNPNYVPATGTTNALYALRLEVLSSTYSTNLAQYTSNEQQVPVNIAPYQDKNVPQDVGTILKGDLFGSTPSVMVMLPLRTNTIEVWSNNPAYFNTFINQIMPTLKFNP